MLKNASVADVDSGRPADGNGGKHALPGVEDFREGARKLRWRPWARRDTAAEPLRVHSGLPAMRAESLRTIPRGFAFPVTEPARRLPPDAPFRADEREPYACPRCGAEDLTRIPRNFLDRFLALFVDVKRFRCTHVGCHWEGILRSRRKSRRASRGQPR